MQTLYDKMMGVRNDCQSWLIYSPTDIVHHPFLIKEIEELILL